MMKYVRELRGTQSNHTYTQEKQMSECLLVP